MLRCGRRRQFAALSYCLILIIPLIIPAFPAAIIGSAKAAGSCSSQASAIWDVNVANASLLYQDWDEYWDDDGEYIEGDGNQRVKKGMQNSNQKSEPSNVNRVDELTNGFHVSKIVENGTSEGIRINLTTVYTSTFCVTRSAHNSSISAPVDVYLMTGEDWNRYETSFSAANNQWGELFNLSEIPPEWRSGSFWSWRPYRDVHAYEDLTEVTFSTSLDQIEYDYNNDYYGSNSISVDEFYLVVDGWDNARDSDAGDPNVDIELDITIMVEERMIVPTWTVSLVCTAVLVSFLAVPVVIHSKYHKTGLVETGVEFMPSLNTEAEQEMSIDSDLSTEKDYSVLE